ncbi:MAG: hypothetical protein AAFV26_03915, partial [Pseudomonadota bacterium]
DDALAKARPAMEAVSATIHRVGTKPGEGQTVKACLLGQSSASVVGREIVGTKRGTGSCRPRHARDAERGR